MYIKKSFTTNFYIQSKQISLLNPQSNKMTFIPLIYIITDKICRVKMHCFILLQWFLGKNILIVFLWLRNFLATVYFMRKPTYFPVQQKLLSRKGKMAFLANDDITQKYGGNVTYYLSFMVDEDRHLNNSGLIESK